NVAARAEAGIDEAFNGIFQAARARARGYRNVNTFITMIYLIAAPLGDILKST
ncbi:MAG: transposase, partial [Rhodospirillaceae bacterium]|nr:transposase [Rhodospirillales bacterium]